MNSEDYIRHDATALAALIRSGDVSRPEVLQAAQDRIAACNPSINAIVELYDEPVEDSSVQGVFAGVPFLLKDIGAGIAGK